MRKVLFVTPCFLPENTIGSRRPAGLAKYLKEFGWDVTILTQCEPEHIEHPLSREEMQEAAGLDESRIIRIVRSVRPLSRSRVLKAFRGIAEYWVLPGSDNSHAARLALQQTRELDLNVDVIWATAPGYSVFLIASGLAQRLGIPWVADFRDVADQYLFYPRWVRRIMAWREARFCRSASHITSVVDPEPFTRRHRAPVTLVTNGFDPDQLCEIPKKPEGRGFRIVYTGSIQGVQDLGPVIQAMNELVGDGAIPADEIGMEFYGFAGRRARKACGHERRSPGIAVKLGSWVPHSESLRLQRGATVLLLLGVPGAPFVTTGKLFEYMASGRPVLAYPVGDSGADPILKSTGIGRSCGSVCELKAVISQWYQEWKATGDIHMDRNLVEIRKWSRREQARTLAAVLEGVVQRSP